MLRIDPECVERYHQLLSQYSYDVQQYGFYQPGDDKQQIGFLLKFSAQAHRSAKALADLHKAGWPGYMAWRFQANKWKKEASRHRAYLRKTKEGREFLSYELED